MIRNTIAVGLVVLLIGSTVAVADVPDSDVTGISVSVNDIGYKESRALTVTASFDNGSDRQVTPDTVSINNTVVSYNASAGTLEWERPGTAEVTVEYAGEVTRYNLTERGPFTGQTDGETVSVSVPEQVDGNVTFTGNTTRKTFSTIYSNNLTVRDFYVTTSESGTVSNGDTFATFNNIGYVWNISDYDQSATVTLYNASGTVLNQTTHPAGSDGENLFEHNEFLDDPVTLQIETAEETINITEDIGSGPDAANQYENRTDYDIISSNNVTVNNGQLETTGTKYWETVEAFDDGDLSEYTGDTGSYAIEFGSNQLTSAFSNTGFLVIARDDNLFERGKDIRWYHKWDATPDSLETGWLAQDASNRYNLRIDEHGGQNDIDLIKRESGTNTELDSVTYTDYYPADTAVDEQKVYVEWSGPNNHTMTVKIDDVDDGYFTGNITLSATDSTFDEGGIAMVDGPDTDFTGYWDDFQEERVDPATGAFAEFEHPTELSYENVTALDVDPLGMDFEVGLGFSVGTDPIDEGQTITTSNSGQDVYTSIGLSAGEVGNGFTVQPSTTTDLKTEDPAVDLDGDGSPDVTYIGTLNDTETVTKPFSTDLNGSYTWTTETANGSVVDWSYDGREPYGVTETFTDTTVVTALPAQPERIGLSSDTSVPVNGSGFNTVFVYYENNTKEDVTDASTYTSSNTTILTVASNGTMFGQGIDGRVDVTADYTAFNGQTYTNTTENISVGDPAPPTGSTAFVSQDVFTAIQFFWVFGGGIVGVIFGVVYGRIFDRGIGQEVTGLAGLLTTYFAGWAVGVVNVVYLIFAIMLGIAFLTWRYNAYDSLGQERRQRR